MTGALPEARGAGSAMRRYILAAGFACIVGWLSIGVSANLSFKGAKAATAHAIWPWGADAQVRMANAVLTAQDADSTEIGNALALAQAALQREPVNAVAARSMGLAYARLGSPDQASRHFHYAERMSRRDLATQLWLIEEAVQGDNVRQALTHYDRALRTSRQSAGFLLPTLAVAADDPELSGDVARLLARQPNWSMAFLNVALTEMQSGPAILALGRGMRWDLNDGRSFSAAQGMLQRLVALKDYRSAQALYTLLRKGQGSSPLGDFASRGRRPLLPMEWWLSDDPNATLSIDPARKGRRLQVEASVTDTMVVARRLVIFAPGRYRVKGLAGGENTAVAERPSITLKCEAGPLLADIALPTEGGRMHPFVAEIVVPADCPAQMFSISTGTASTPPFFWIDALSVDDLD